MDAARQELSCLTRLLPTCEHAAPAAKISTGSSRPLPTRIEVSVTDSSNGRSTVPAYRRPELLKWNSPFFD